MFMALTTGSSTNLAFTLVVISASLTTTLAGLSVRWVQPPKAMAEPSSAAVRMDLAFMVVVLLVYGYRNEGSPADERRASHLARIGSPRCPLCRMFAWRKGHGLRFPRRTMPTHPGRSATTRGCVWRRRFYPGATTTMWHVFPDVECPMNIERSKRPAIVVAFTAIALEALVLAACDHPTAEQAKRDTADALSLI